MDRVLQGLQGIVQGVAQEGDLIGQTISQATKIVTSTVYEGIGAGIEFLQTADWWPIIKEQLGGILNPWPALSGNVSQAWSEAKNLVSSLWNLDLGQAPRHLSGIVQAGICAIDSLGLYLYLILLIAPTALGTLGSPGVGNAVGAALGQAASGTFATVLSAADIIASSLLGAYGFGDLFGLVNNKLRNRPAEFDPDNDDVRELMTDEESTDTVGWVFESTMNVLPPILVGVMAVLGPLARKIGRAIFDSLGGIGQKVKKRLNQVMERFRKKKDKDGDGGDTDSDSGGGKDDDDGSGGNGGDDDDNGTGNGDNDDDGNNDNTQAEFEAAQKAWSNLPTATRSMMHGVNNGSRPLSDFTSLPVDQQNVILEYYRATAANASKANAEAVRQLNRHRIEYLTGLRPDPPGGIGNFPKPKGT